MDTKETRQVLLEGIEDGTIRPLEALKLQLLVEILDELRSIREAAETEAVEDAEPDPYQTLNGPSQ